MANIIVSKLDADQIIRLSYDEAAKALKTIPSSSGLTPSTYNSVILTYNGNSDIATVTYFQDATQVGMLTLGYDGQNRLVSVVRS